MESAIMLSLTVMCDEESMVIKATEAITRAQVGLALEGLHTTLSISTVEYEQSEQEHRES